ncbi:MAG: 1-acyl-sn-glycerol-3-phosphate acyltransferase [Pseudomonadota bacterium]|nr:1-acyl-sn-glycerol-3-phosphate acyltransferase [Pseudomonadota bacterium]
MIRVRPYVTLVLFVAASVAVIPPQWIFTKVWPAAARRLPHYYFRAVAQLLRMRVRVAGEPLKHRPCLYVANHGSWLDIVVLSAIAPMCFVAKKEVASWPFFGTLASIGRTLYIDRNRRHDVGRSHTALKARLHGGEIVTLFAEGKPSDGNRVLPFRSALLGAADVEVEGVPVAVQPVTIAYTGMYGIPIGRGFRPLFAWYGNMTLFAHLMGVGAAGPPDVEVVFHPVVHGRDVGGRKALARHCEQQIKRALAQALTGRQPRVPAPVEMF